MDRRQDGVRRSRRGCSSSRSYAIHAQTTAIVVVYLLRAGEYCPSDRVCRQRLTTRSSRPAPIAARDVLLIFSRFLSEVPRWLPHDGWIYNISVPLSAAQNSVKMRQRSIQDEPTIFKATVQAPKAPTRTYIHLVYIGPYSEQKLTRPRACCVRACVRVLCRRRVGHFLRFVAPHVRTYGSPLVCIQY